MLVLEASTPPPYGPWAALGIATVLVGFGAVGLIGMHRFESGYGDNGAKFRQQSLGWQQILITLTGTLRPATFGMFFAAAGMACFALYIWTDVNVFGILFAVSMVACVASFAWSLKLWFWPNPLRQLPDWLR